MRHAELRATLVAVARAMNARRLNQGTAGNLSARVPEGMLVTPSAVPYDRLDPDGIVLMELDGTVLEGDRPPTSEWQMHAQILRRRPDLDAVLHAHPTFCTTHACARRDIPPFHYMVAVAGGTDIRCAPYAMFGSAELAQHAVHALEGRSACLLANHGMLAVGLSPEAALELAAEVETLAELYWRALAVGEPVLLTTDEMAAAIERFESYR